MEEEVEEEEEEAGDEPRVALETTERTKFVVPACLSTSR